MIYLVEDDASIRELEAYALTSSGLEVKAFDSAAPFWEAMRAAPPELVILDIMLPGQDGLSILRQLRTVPATKKLPVVMVTARDAEIDVVKALDGGADEYIAKPFGVLAFVSRVKAVLRRSRPETEPARDLRVGPVFLSDTAHTVQVAGRPVPLTYKEFELLRLLMEHAGTAVSRDVILARVWEADAALESRTLDMHVRSLRQKLGEAGGCIVTVRKVGFRFEEEPEADA